MNVAPNTYSRIMTQAFDEAGVISVSTAGQAFFGNPANGSFTTFSMDAKVADIDIIRGNEKTAALIQRGGGGFRNLSGQKSTSDQQYSSFSRSFPLSEEEGHITSSKLLDRMAGEPVYNGFTQQQRAQRYAIRHHGEHIRRNVRLFERLAWEVILTGTQSAILGTTKNDLIYDYLRDAGNSITPITKWDDTTPDIMGDIDAGCDQMRAKGRTTPDMLIMGGGAINAAINDAAFQKLADNRGFKLIQISSTSPVPEKYTRWTKAGFDARGFLVTPVGRILWVFTYQDGYDDDGGTFTKYMPSDKCVLISTNARFDRMFGPGETLPSTPQRDQWFRENFGFDPIGGQMPTNIKNPGAVVNPQMFSFDGYGSSDAKTLVIRTQAAPLFITTQTDTIVTLDDVLT